MAWALGKKWVSVKRIMFPAKKNNQNIMLIELFAYVLTNV